MTPLQSMQSLQLNQRTQTPSRRALLSWALIVACSLLFYLVHVLNEQVRQGEAAREQFRQASRTVVSPKLSQPVAAAGADGLLPSRQAAAPR